MKRNSVSVAMLAALAVCGVIQTASSAQGGVVLPEPAAAPPVRVVPHVVEYPAKHAQAVETMPRPATRPIAATGRIVHVQQLNNTGVIPPQGVMPPQGNPALAPMSMGGFTTIAPRPVSVAPSAGGR